MKLFAILASFVSVTAASYNVTFDTFVDNTTKVIHGQAYRDTTHCEEIYIPGKLSDKFSRWEGYKYRKYKTGVCAPPYDKYSSKTDDDIVPGVTHYKRVKATGSDTASVTLSGCSCTGSQDMGMSWSLSPSSLSPKKGTTISIVGTGTLHETLDSSNHGSYTITASYGSLSLVNSRASNCDTISASLPLGLGQIKSSRFSCPQSAGAATFTVSIPIPNLSGSVTANAVSSDGNGNCLYCVNLAMTL